MRDAFICEAVRTPIGRLNGALATIRADDLAAIPIRALVDRCPSVDWEEVDDTIIGCANQAGEDNRNIARMAVLLAGLPDKVPGETVNRLCGSGMNAIGHCARAIRLGEADLMIAGGAESMTRAPYVLGKPQSSFDRTMALEDSTMGWRFINPRMLAEYGAHSMPETAENLAAERGISREEQDAFAFASQQKAAMAQSSGRLAVELVAVTVKPRRGDPVTFDKDEHPRPTSIDALADLRPIVHRAGTITAGNASGLNDGAAAMLIASEGAAKRHGLKPRARLLGMVTAGVAPRIMGIGPVEAARKLLVRHDLTFDDMSVIELNEAFAAQAIAVLRELELDPADPRVNPNGGAIALGHPLGMSGARIVMTAVEELHRSRGRFALACMCIGVGQGIAVLIERI